jgi:two-component system sensor histidine kinase BaeS
LLVAFVLVAFAAVAVVTVGALVGSAQGLSSQVATERSDTAQRAAASAAAAYRASGGWAGADLARTAQVAEAAGAALAVFDVNNQAVFSSGVHGPGNGSSASPGMGNGIGSGTGSGMGKGVGNGIGPAAGTVVTAGIPVDGAEVGSVRLRFAASSTPAGRPVAWSWVFAAALAALVAAATAAWVISRWLSRPLVELTATARAFGAGSRDARPRLTGPGELGELAAAFSEAATAVQTSDNARRRMAADVAHELRTPLAALQAGLEELRDGLAPPDTAALARLHDQSLRLSRIVADLASLASAEAASIGLRLAPVDLVTVVTAEFEAREPQLRACGLHPRLHVVERAPAVADQERVHQVVGNLLENCARHCRPGDAVQVSVTAGPAVAPDDRPGVQSGAHPGRQSRQMSDTWHIVVADTGPGIDEGDQPHVFTRFWRAKDRVGVAGSGLGLAVVRSLVEAHRGRVSVTSDGRSGTMVTVELPAAAHPTFP